MDIKSGEEREILLNNCYICNCGDLGQYDIIYECVVYGIKLHQEYYVINPNTEQKNWKCSKCKKMKYREAVNMECLLCPCKGGAMKQTKISKESDFYKNLMKFRGKIIEEEDKKNNNDIIKKDSSNIKHPDHPWINLSSVFGNEDVKINMNGKKKNIKFEEINMFIYLKFETSIYLLIFEIIDFYHNYSFGLFKLFKYLVNYYAIKKRKYILNLSIYILINIL